MQPEYAVNLQKVPRNPIRRNILFKTFGIAALAVVVALFAGFGARGATTPTAHASTTDVVVIGCEFIAGSVDGNAANTITNADVQAACGGSATVGGPATSLPPTAAPGVPSIANLALAIGNEDGILTASDFRSDSLDENWDQNQLSTDCTTAGRTYVTALAPILTGDFVNGLSCTLDVFVFVDHEGPVTLSLPTGLASLESPTTADFICTKEATVPSTVAIATSGTTAAVTLAVTGTSNANPDVITVASTATLTTGNTVTITGAVGDTAINGTFVVSVLSGTTFSIPVAGNGAWTSGGTVTEASTLTNSIITTTTASGLAVGDQITIAGSTDTGLNTAVGATWTVATIIDATHFTLTGFTSAIPVGTGGTITSVLALANPTIGLDNDCSNGPPTGILNNGDGVVMFHILEGVGSAAATAGSVKTVSVSQDAVEQTFDVNVVGPANNVELTLAEKVIQTNSTTANVTNCITNTAVTDGVTPPTSTVAWAVATDQDNTILTRVPVLFAVTPPEDSEIAKLGIGNPGEEVTSNTYFTVHPANAALPTAAYVVICGGTQAGTATIDASINNISCATTGCTILSSRDHSSQDLTVGGVPSSNVVTASPSSIACDGTQTSTVTAKVTDSAGNNVADGVPVNFSVVALGTANPINTTTKDGIATSVITPLSNSSAGTTVIVTAGDSSIAATVQTSVRVDCSLPLATQPTPASAAAPTPRGGIAGPDTGTGGYLNQNGSNGFPMWTLIALALGSMALVAGGLVTRRAGK
jgi:adhesin/invasin